MAGRQSGGMALPSREFVISEVDREFRLQHPEAPHVLDPHDPRQTQLVRDWWEMYERFVNATVDSHYYRFFPHSPRLDPANPEHAQLIEYWQDIRSVVRDGATPRYDWDETRLRAEQAAAAGTPATTTTTAPPTADPGTPPHGGVEMDEDAVKEALHQWLEGAHYLGDTAEVLGLLARAGGAGEHAGLVVFGEALGPVGMVASTVIVLWATAHAFGTGRRLQEQEGFCYGVMWEAFGMSDSSKGFVDWFNDSAEELRESFEEGIAAGRAKARETTVHNRLLLLVAYHQAQGDDLATAQGKVLNELWLQLRESDKGRDWLSWPVPTSMPTE